MIEVRPYAFRNEFTDHAYSVFSDGRRVLDVGFKVQDLLTRRLYLWAWPHIALNQLALSDWRDLRKRLEDFGEATLTVNIFCEDETAVRFAKFFGFEGSHVVDDRLIMIRKVR